MPVMLRFAVPFALLLAATAPATVRAEITFAIDNDLSLGFCVNCGAGGWESAVQSCKDAGGPACQIPLTCPRGWAAIASSSNDWSEALAISCGIRSEALARLASITACMTKLNGYCTTTQTISPNGKITKFTAPGPLFTTYIAQAALGLSGYDVGTPDGEMGPKTRAALHAFQDDIGLAKTDDISPETAWRTIMAFGGRQKLWDIIAEEVVAPNVEALGNQLYISAPKAKPPEPFGAELAGYEDDVRRNALALYLRGHGHPCSIPAIRATAPFENDTVYWNVDCKEAEYDLFLQPDGSNVINSTPK